VTQALVDGFAELTLGVRDREAMERLHTDDVLVVGIWDLFRRGEGRCEGIGALAQREAAATDASN
jgi:hypothetical protein